MTQHRWGEKAVVSPYKTERLCIRGCGTVMVTRHEPDAWPPHWIEFWNGLDKFEGRGRPVCEPVEVVA